MSRSPEKKRMKTETKSSLQRDITENAVIQKRLRSETQSDLEAQNMLKTLRKKNFVTACEEVSCEAYFNRQRRLQLVYLPACAKAECNHSNKQESFVKEMPPYAVESFKIEVNTGKWYDALEVCQMSITNDQYLSAEVMKEIVEIMMNVHEDMYVSYTIEELIDKCQQVLALNFSTHPPCHEQNLRKCYKTFLTSPMDLRENTFTNREIFGCSQGIVKYCMNRLSDDINEKSRDEPIINKYENIPDEMKEGVQGLHWQKEKFDIFELLRRPERIKRLMAVLESVIELLQYDLIIWQTRHTSKLGRYIMEPKNKPLIAFLLWSDNPLITGAVTNNCLQIMKLFIYFIHLQYPEDHIRVMTTWLNTMIETFYICETKSNSDYPNLGKYCAAFANKFYENMKNLAHDSVIRILERIQPSFMQHLIGIHITKSFLSIKEDNVVKILIDFIKTRRWKEYSESEEAVKIFKSRSVLSSINNILDYLTEKCKLEQPSNSNSDNNNNTYPKLQPLEYIIDMSDHELYHVVHAMFITLSAYLEAYSFQSVQDTLDSLNEMLAQGNLTRRDEKIQSLLPHAGIYSVSEDFIKKYRTMYQTLKELIIIWLEMKDNKELPKVLEVFENLSILGCND